MQMSGFFLIVQEFAGKKIKKIIWPEEGKNLAATHSSCIFISDKGAVKLKT
jgi:hypothetical protein